MTPYLIKIEFKHKSIDYIYFYLMTTLSPILTPAVVCKNFMYNNCQRTNCKFIHDNNICFYFWKFGSCKRESECNKSHTFIKDQDQIKNKDQIKNQDQGKKNNKNEFVENGQIKQDSGIDKKVENKKNKDKYNKELRKNLKNNKNKHIKNTECFDPMTKPVDMRFVLDVRSFKHNNNSDIPELTSRDVLLSPKLFDDFDKYEIYNKLVSEIQNCGIPEEQLLKMWHGNDKIEGTHLIANDRANWKEKCQTFNMVISRLKDVFKMDIKATRLNWYRDPDHFKPFHHDSSFINPERALTQNFTVAVSFGVTKDAAFEHSQTKTVISIPQPDGTAYSFTNDTNGIWRHGILQDKTQQDLGRISIIAWGWIDDVKTLK